MKSNARFVNYTPFPSVTLFVNPEKLNQKKVLNWGYISLPDLSYSIFTLRLYPTTKKWHTEKQKKKKLSRLHVISYWRLLFLAFHYLSVYYCMIMLSGQFWKCHILCNTTFRILDRRIESLGGYSVSTEYIR